MSKVHLKIIEKIDRTSSLMTCLGQEINKTSKVNLGSIFALPPSYNDFAKVYPSNRVLNAQAKHNRQESSRDFLDHCEIHGPK